MMFAFAACAPDLQRASSGAIGCPVDEIEISEVDPGWAAGSWAATCHDKKFYC
jgi:hypothetical protein